MTRGALDVAPIVAIALVCAAGTAHAEPSIWARAKNPRVASEAEAIAKTDRAVSRDYSLSRTAMTFRRATLLRRTLSSLRRAKAPSSKNPQLRYRLAQVYYRLHDVDPNLKHIEAATEHYEFVVAAPDVPRTMRARALMSLAICHARLGRHGDEVAAYNHAIAIQPDPISHAVLLANQAEGLMARGRIVPAVRGYRASLRATPSPLMIESGVTTMWGLAVALDRSGDLDRALENVRRARSYDPGDVRINGPGWFYVPSYDEHWYEALGHWQIARDAKAPHVKREAYDAAIASWRAFVGSARTDDPWLRIADFRLTQCEDEKRRALERLELDQDPTRRKKPSFQPPHKNPTIFF